MRKFLVTVVFFLMLESLSVSVFAWNAVGHRIIAQIAYDQLTPIAKAKIDALTMVMFHSSYADNRFARASTWPDQLKRKTARYNSWHYINLPLVENGIHPPRLNPDNVVWAIAQAEKIVKNSAQNKYVRGQYLSFLIHFVGDVHQPMHCVTLYDHLFPHGDRGGNAYLIHSSIAKNLHQLWDRGLGLFVSSPGNYQYHYWQIQKIATQWMHLYPRAFFAKQLIVQSPKKWAQASYQIAVSFAYTLPPNTVPFDTYIKQGQVIVRKQCVLAGDRLADILNQLFS